MVQFLEVTWRWGETKVISGSGPFRKMSETQLPEVTSGQSPGEVLVQWSHTKYVKDLFRGPWMAPEGCSWALQLWLQQDPWAPLVFFSSMLLNLRNDAGWLAPFQTTSSGKRRITRLCNTEECTPPVLGPQPRQDRDPRLQKPNRRAWKQCCSQELKAIPPPPPTHTHDASLHYFCLQISSIIVQRGPG